MARYHELTQSNYLWSEITALSEKRSIENNIPLI